MSTKRLETEEDKGHAGFIPSEVIYDILLRLPAKSLLRFRSLSKHYLSVISHSDFIGHHIGFSSSNSANKSSLLLYLHRYPSLRISFLNPDLTISPIFVPDLIGQGIGPSLDVTGSCYGLLLAEVTNYKHRQLLLWKPATRHFRYLPLPTPDNSLYGLGFNSHIDDYCVMQISYLDVHKNMHVSYFELQDDSENIIVQAKLFSCRKNIWTTVCSNLPLAYYTSPVPQKLGGRDHLCWRGIDRNGGMFILAFDMIKLDFREVEYPLHDHFVGMMKENLTHFKESLAVILYSYEIYSENSSNINWIELWVLNNENSSDGSRDSWTRIYNIRPLPSGIRPVIIWGEGELIFYKDGRLCACDIVDGLDLENTSIRHISDTYLYGGFAYVESLAPVYGDNEVEDI